MEYDIAKAIEVLERTPAALAALLGGLSDDWVMANEGPDTFSPYDVVGHLIHGEKTDWVPRIKRILEFGSTQTFDLYDRFAQYEASKGKSLQQLLDELAVLRKENMAWFKGLRLKDNDLDRKGMHPKLGEVTLRNLLACWVAHDLTHMAQVTRVMAKQYKTEMGPWTQYFRILDF